MNDVPTPVLDRHTYFSEWSLLHGGYDPASGAWVIRVWLGLVYRIARPLAAAGAGPTGMTFAGVLITATTVPLALFGDRWPLLAALIVVASGLLDNLDGAVAILRRRVTAWGYVLDSVADRVSDGLYLVALWLLGAPAGLVVAAGSCVMLLEYLRARSVGAGHGEIGVVTVGERPTRIIVAAVSLAGAGAVPSLAATAGTIGGSVTLALSVGGLVQYGIVVHRVLSRSQAGPTSSATMRADSAANGRPPPGWVEPPTRKSPGTGEELAGRRKAARAPSEEDP